MKSYSSTEFIVTGNTYMLIFLRKISYILFYSNRRNFMMFITSTMIPTITSTTRTLLMLSTHSITVSPMLSSWWLTRSTSPTRPCRMGEGLPGRQPPSSPSSPGTSTATPPPPPPPPPPWCPTPLPAAQAVARAVPAAARQA